MRLCQMCQICNLLPHQVFYHGDETKVPVIAVCGLLLLVLGCQPPGHELFSEARLKAGEPKLAIAQFEKAVKLLPGEWRA